MTHFLSPASEALDPGMVVGLIFKIVVGVCLLSEHRSEDGGALSLYTNIQERNTVVGLLFRSELNGGGVLAVETSTYQTPNTTNLDCGLTLDSIWFPLLT